VIGTHFSTRVTSAVGIAKETKFGTKVAYGVRMMPELRIHAYSTMKNMTCVTETRDIQ